MKFEAKDGHWRVVPEFKNVTLRLIPETSTLIAALKTKEVDLAQVPAEPTHGFESIRNSSGS